MGKACARIQSLLVSPRVWAAVASTVLVAAVVLYYVLPDYRGAIARCRGMSSTIVLDRDHRLLHIFPDAQERRTLWKPIEEFPELLKRTVIAAEDKRFLSHYGFDLTAIFRALWTNIRSGRTVSGASTITQQAVRLITPRPRTYRAKVYELLAAIKMESQLSKEQILELYLNLSPMGSNIRGAALAALMYFDKDVKHVNPAEAAILAAIPRSPHRLCPRTQTGRRQLIREKDRILHRMADLGWLSSENLNRMVGMFRAFRITTVSKQAPHFVDFVTASVPKTGAVVRTTLTLDLHHTVEDTVRSHRNRVAGMGIEQVGVLVTSVSGEILAMVGSMHYGRRDGGFNNAVLAPRGAGSTLKPFLYALALEKGYSAASEIPDTFQSYRTPQGDYLPHNADRRNYGPVTARSALGNSLNVSAVKVARNVGLHSFFHLLQRLELVEERSSSPERYGLGLAIGNVEVSLYKLVRAYNALAGQGDYSQLQAVNNRQGSASHVFSRQTAYVINHILADPTARLLTFGNPSWFEFGFPVAVKTGTSSNFRDCWTVAYTSRHVVGVWAGNFDGRPNNGVAGSTACGPIVHDIIDALYRGLPPEPFRKPDGVHEVMVCSLSGKRATPACPYQTKDFWIGDVPHALESSAAHPEGTSLTEHPARLPQTQEGAGRASSSVGEPGICDIPHDSRQHHFLGAPYAQWIDRRETELGPGRFRLAQPEPFSAERSARLPLILSEPGTNKARQRIEIVSPHDADRFVLSPYRPNRVLFRAVPHPVVHQVTWLLDGVEIATTPPPYEFFWQPTRGTHAIHAVTPGKAAARVTIHVE
jgi:penicillin-binding protein 1C